MCKMSEILIKFRSHLFIAWSENMKKQIIHNQKYKKQILGLFWICIFTFNCSTSLDFSIYLNQNVSNRDLNRIYGLSFMCES